MYLGMNSKTEQEYQLPTLIHVCDSNVVDFVPSEIPHLSGWQSGPFQRFVGFRHRAIDKHDTVDFRLVSVRSLQPVQNTN
jgi:hypothetical protein